MTNQAAADVPGARPSRATRARRRALTAVAGAVVLVLTAVLSGCTGSGAPESVPTGTLSVSLSPQAGSVVSRAEPGRTPVGAKWDWSRYSAFTPFLGSLAGSFTTYELVWCEVESEPGVWRWSDVDTAVSQTRALGIELGLKVRTGACWATKSGPEIVRGDQDKTESVPPADMGAYKLFLRRAVHRYAPQGVTKWAIENEINSDGMWRGTLDEYATLATTAAHLIRRIEPGAVMVDPGLSSSTNGVGVVDWLLQHGREQDALNVYNAYFERRTNRRDDLPTVTTVPELRQVMGSEYATDALSVLAADRELIDKGVFDIRQVHFYESWLNIPALFAWLDEQNAPDTRVEVWEAGQYQLDESVTDQEHAVEAAKTVTLLLAGGAQEVVWLPLAFDPSGRHADEPRYSLVDPDGTVRPAGAMIADLAALSRGARVVPVSVAGVQGVIFTRGDVSNLVMWSADGGDHAFDPGDLRDATLRPLGSAAPTAPDGPTTITGTPEVVTATATPVELLERLR